MLEGIINEKKCVFTYPKRKTLKAMVQYLRAEKNPQENKRYARIHEQTCLER